MRLIPRLTLPTLPNLPTLARTAYAFCLYKFPYNVNQEEHASYLKKVARAEQELTQLQSSNLVPRRRRRVFDRPKHDLDTTGYTAWRLYHPEEMLYKFEHDGAPVAAKLQLQPRWVIHAFGMGLLPLNHSRSASLEFSFEDNNLSKFLLYEYRNTTQFKANDPNYDYKDQEKVAPKQRKVFRLPFEEFWKSEEYFEFRLNCTAYAEHLKFKKWVEETVEARKSQESYDSFIDKKYGPLLTYNRKEDSSQFAPFKPAILSVTPNHFSLPKKGEKLKEPKVELPKKLGEEHRLKEKKEVGKEEAKEAKEAKSQSS